MAQPETTLKKETLDKMRAVLTDACNLFAKHRDRVGARCFNDGSDWQIALSEAVTKTPDSKKISSNEAVYFFRLSEVFNNPEEVDPRIFLIGILASLTDIDDIPLVFNIWDGIEPGWKASVEANARSAKSDIKLIVDHMSNCLDESVVNQMPNITEIGDGKSGVEEVDDETDASESESDKSE